MNVRGLFVNLIIVFAFFKVASIYDGKDVLAYIIAGVFSDFLVSILFKITPIR